ncbi:uncharacterized protein LOC129669484 [Psammomys obesus]|uniref:uncharacterized protein LOC129669484 n=1 Tax=Psammomys obesus TaxID=48139 RepID=UPI0024531C1A|nr:uncharacterized protein LOC129669484 [Psammomys obesus]
MQGGGAGRSVVGGHCAGLSLPSPPARRAPRKRAGLGGARRGRAGTEPERGPARGAGPAGHRERRRRRARESRCVRNSPPPAARGSAPHVRSLAGCSSPRQLAKDAPFCLAQARDVPEQRRQRLNWEAFAELHRRAHRGAACAGSFGAAQGLGTHPQPPCRSCSERDSLQSRLSPVPTEPLSRHPHRACFLDSQHLFQPFQICAFFLPFPWPIPQRPP